MDFPCKTSFQRPLKNIKRNGRSDMRKKERERCDSCKKWVSMGELMTLPEEIYPILKYENEFCVCLSCIDKYTVEDWKNRVIILRKRNE